MSTPNAAVEISAKLVKELRDRTNAGFNDCRAALIEAGGDIEKAIAVLRKKGQAAAAKKATRTIPVVMAGSGDPVSSGIVATLGRPGGNITGLSSLIPDLNAKRVELLGQGLPRPARVAVLFNWGTR